MPPIATVDAILVAPGALQLKIPLPTVEGAAELPVQGPTSFLLASISRPLKQTADVEDGAKDAHNTTISTNM